MQHLVVLAPPNQQNLDWMNKYPVLSKPNPLFYIDPTGIGYSLTFPNVVNVFVLGNVDVTRGVWDQVFNFKKN